jgi:hypothetical protein
LILRHFFVKALALKRGFWVRFVFWWMLYRPADYLSRWEETTSKINYGG